MLRRLGRAFGARIALADGKVMHAEARVDDTVIRGGVKDLGGTTRWIATRVA